LLTLKSNSDETAQKKWKTHFIHSVCISGLGGSILSKGSKSLYPICTIATFELTTIILRSLLQNKWKFDKLKMYKSALCLKENFWIIIIIIIIIICTCMACRNSGTENWINVSTVSVSLRNYRKSRDRKSQDTEPYYDAIPRKLCLEMIFS